jgi:hypothetical protein
LKVRPTITENDDQPDELD